MKARSSSSQILTVNHKLTPERGQRVTTLTPMIQKIHAIFLLHDVCQTLQSKQVPTVSVLLRARSNIINQSIVPKLLVIGQPGETLPNVQDEINYVRQLGDFVDVIVGPDASRDSVLRGLHQHSWAHFSCHGHLGDNGEAFHGSFELYDDTRLTLLDLIQARLPNAELALLTTWHGAAGHSSTPDETIHLAAALQFCGFRSVVGSTWAMNDEDGPTLSK